MYPAAASRWFLTGPGHDDVAAARCPRHRGSACVSLDRSGIREALSVVSDLGQNSSSGHSGQSREAGDDVGVWVSEELLLCRCGEVGNGIACGVDLLDESHGLAPHGHFDLG